MFRRGQCLLEDAYTCAIAKLREGLWRAQHKYKQYYCMVAGNGFGSPIQTGSWLR
jgi:hypothetical protein